MKKKQNIDATPWILLILLIIIGVFMNIIWIIAALQLIYILAGKPKFLFNIISILLIIAAVMVIIVVLWNVFKYS
jgi:hypothetical protein